jgi:DNA (cytosine-5)-methyltransferase 1
MKLLDLFSGIGGFSYGLEKLGFKTVAFCEMDKYCKLVLQKHWKGVKIYNDVKEITKERLEADGIPSPDIITGGFPCQPFSVAGKQKGTSDDRHLWPEMFRIIKALKPRFVIGENVPGIVNIQDGVVFEAVCTDLESEGYEVQPFNIPAAAVGAPHQRKRIWIVAVRSDVVNTFGNDERREISRSNEEERRIQEEYRTEHSTTRKSSRTSEIRQSNNGYENASHSESERLQRSRGQESSGNVNRFQQDKERIKSEIRGESERRSGTFRDEDVENSRRTLRQGTEFREKNENETRKEDANQHQRSSSPSKFDVANANARLSNGENEEIQTRRDASNISSEKLANTNSERLEGQRKGSGQFSQKFFATDSSKGQQRTMDQGWWSVEPNVGRVANGVPGRVHRLKALGNSIVPKIAEEIGRAIMKAENEN